MKPLKDKLWSEVQGRRSAMAWLGGLFGACAIGLGFYGGPTIPVDHVAGGKELQALVLGLWIVGPPVWFWYEFFYLFKRTNRQLSERPDPDENLGSLDFDAKQLQANEDFATFHLFRVLVCAMETYLLGCLELSDVTAISILKKATTTDEVISLLQREDVDGRAGSNDAFGLGGEGDRKEADLLPRFPN